MDNNENENMLEKLKTNIIDLKKTLSKYITKREIIIVAVVALVVFAILCDKPFSGDFFFMWKPSFWSIETIGSDSGYKVTIPKMGASDSGVELDNIIIKDISSELSDEITSAKDYIVSQINFQVETASNENIPKDVVSEQVQIFETGRVNMGGQDAYYFIFTPGGEYSGNKILQVAIKKGDTLVSAQFRSRWMNFDDNFEQAFKMIKSIRIK